MATTETAWPSAEFPADVKALLDRFFALVESQDENVGSILADEVFTPTGMTQSGLQKFEGREGVLVFALSLSFLSHIWSCGQLCSICRCSLVSYYYRNHCRGFSFLSVYLAFDRCFHSQSPYSLLLESSSHSLSSRSKLLSESFFPSVQLSYVFPPPPPLHVSSMNLTHPLPLEIIASRIDAWKFITSRKHTIFAVFDGNLATPGRDIMMQATVELGLKSGTTLDQQFAARAVVVDWEGAVRLQSFVVWTVCLSLAFILEVFRGGR